MPRPLYVAVSNPGDQWAPAGHSARVGTQTCNVYVKKINSFASTCLFHPFAYMSRLVRGCFTVVGPTTSGWLDEGPVPLLRAIQRVFAAAAHLPVATHADSRSTLRLDSYRPPSGRFIVVVSVVNNLIFIFGLSLAIAGHLWDFPAARGRRRLRSSDHLLVPYPVYIQYIQGRICSSWFSTFPDLPFYP